MIKEVAQEGGEALHSPGERKITTAIASLLQEKEPGPNRKRRLKGVSPVFGGGEGGNSSEKRLVYL